MPLDLLTIAHVRACTYSLLSPFLFLCLSSLSFFYLLIMAKHIIRRAKREAAICRTDNNGAHLSTSRCVCDGFGEVEGIAWCTGMKFGVGGKRKGTGKKRGRRGGGDLHGERHKKNVTMLSASLLLLLFLVFLLLFFLLLSTAVDATPCPFSSLSCRRVWVPMRRSPICSQNTEYRRSPGMPGIVQHACAWLVSLAFQCLLAKSRSRQNVAFFCGWLIEFSDRVTYIFIVINVTVRTNEKMVSWNLYSCRKLFYKI